MHVRRAEILRSLPDSIEKLVDYMIASGIVTKIVLFGSRSRGDARDNSDYDFAIWVSDRAKWVALASEMNEKNITLLPVDILIHDEVSAEYKKNIEREGIVIYGQS